MRTPVNRVKGTPKADTIMDLLSDELSKVYTVARDKEFSHGGKSFTADITLPQYKTIVEVQGKQDNKEIMAEMSRDRIARASGWIIVRCQETVIRHDPDTVLYRVAREIERR
jgi:very-short-patch-repair endonuclease